MNRGRGRGGRGEDEGGFWGEGRIGERIWNVDPSVAPVVEELEPEIDESRGITSRPMSWAGAAPVEARSQMSWPSPAAEVEEVVRLMGAQAVQDGRMGRRGGRAGDEAPREAEGADEGVWEEGPGFVRGGVGCERGWWRGGMAVVDEVSAD